MATAATGAGGRAGCCDQQVRAVGGAVAHQLAGLRRQHDAEQLLRHRVVQLARALAGGATAAMLAEGAEIRGSFTVGCGDSQGVARGEGDSYQARSNGVRPIASRMAGLELQPCRLEFSGDLEAGAGLSSSGALAISRARSRSSRVLIAASPPYFVTSSHNVDFGMAPSRWR